MNLFPISFSGRTVVGAFVASVVTIALSLAYYGALAGVIAYGVVKGIDAAQ